jgi:UDPglucose--hexose-1-phosphate uridylyltransferase
MPELRKDPVIGRWVIISTERSKRPMDFECEAEPVAGANNCPFCEGREKLTPSEILAYRDDGSSRDGPGWRIRVVPNKFPALTIEGDLERAGEGMFDRMKGVGAHEVIIETPEHVRNLTDLSTRQVEDVIWAYRDRIMDLKKDPRLRYVLIFKNKGSAAGASLEHTHSQLIGLPIVPKRVTEEIAGAREYYSFKERCVFCDIVRQESYDGSRVVAENPEFIAICPFAPKGPFEIWIIPRSHVPAFENSRKQEYENLARILQLVLKKLQASLCDPPYNYIIHTSPFQQEINYYHWHIELMPILTKVAGFEWGSGFYINPTPPEEAARFLRDVKVD